MTSLVPFKQLKIARFPLIRAFQTKPSLLRQSPPPPPDFFPPAKSSAYEKTQPKEDKRVRIRLPGVPFAVALPENLRLSNFPLYLSPSISYVLLAKRVSLSAACVGLYGAYWASTASLLSTELVSLLGVLSVLPFPLVTYFTQNYVSRIYRLYDTSKSQTLDNMVQKETLVMERMMFGGKRCYNVLAELEYITIKKNWYGQTVWHYKNKEGLERDFYVSDDVGGAKMDRIWGIIEKNSGIDNGRLLLEAD